MGTASGVLSGQHCFAAGGRASARKKQHMRTRSEGQGLPFGLDRSTGKDERDRQEEKQKIRLKLQEHMNKRCTTEKQRLQIKYKEKMH